MNWVNVLCLSLILALLGTAEERKPRKMNQWMHAIEGELSLGKINLLGSHDAAALRGGTYGQCQDETISAQLELGVRFLDIRCKLIEGELKIFHGIVDQKLKFKQVIETCQQFLNKHPSEVVIISIKHEGGKVSKGEFGAAVQKVLGGNNDSVYSKGEIPLLGKVRGKIVIVTRHSEVKGIEWKSFNVQDHYAMKGTDALNQKWTWIKRQLEKMSLKPKINCISCSGILYPPRRNAKVINPRVIEYLKKKKPKYVGIIMADFISKELAEAVVELNF